MPSGINSVCSWHLNAFSDMRRMPPDKGAHANFYYIDFHFLAVGLQTMHAALGLGTCVSVWYMNAKRLKA